MSCSAGAEGPAPPALRQVPQNCGAGGGDRGILTAASAAHANGADDRSAAPQRQTAGEDHAPPVARSVNSEERLARLTAFGELRRRNVEGARGLVDRKVDAADR